MKTISHFLKMKIAGGIAMVADMTGKSKLCQQIEENVSWLSQFGLDEKKGVTRLLYTEEWNAAQKALEEKMKGLHLKTYYDDVGNLFGRLQGTGSEQQVILTGSHIDTVINGGKYDGAFGVVAGIIALQYLYAHYGSPTKTLEVVSLCEEEGSRFPLTYWGSGNMNGLHSKSDAKHVINKEGVKLDDAMKQLNFGKGLHSEPYRTDIASFIELHIEQGKQLEMSRCDIGIVSSIVGQKRFTVSVKGESNHAGTTPMNIRKDAFYVSCKLAKAFIELSEKYHNALYVTVGKITLSPNAPNVIPGYVEFTVDIRHHEYKILQEAEREMKEIIKRTAGDLEVNIDCWMDEKPVAMSKELSELSKIISSEKNISSRELVSGAGHDSQVFGRRVPTCLLFVPSQDGISHSPKEFTKGEQLEKGVKVLIELLYKLAY